MFTGIVEEIGKLREVSHIGESIRLRIACKHVLSDLKIGDSIAVDGCCLTAETVDGSGFTAFASPETLKKTSLGERLIGDGLNLERAMTLETRLGGHLVSGHVDATGVFRGARELSKSWEIRIDAPIDIIESSIRKGSICIDGISLTIVNLDHDELSAWIIPETWEKTTLHEKKAGQRVNLESDLIGKYVYRFMETRGEESTDAIRDKRIEELLSKGNWAKR